MKRRGRKPASTNKAAHEARDRILKYCKKYGLTVAELARRAGCNSSSTWRAMRLTTPRWSPTFTKLDEFVKSEEEIKSSTAAAGKDQLADKLEQVANRGGNPSAATAALLRVVADLLDGSTASSKGVSR